MPTPAGTFRAAVGELVSTATGISIVVQGERTGVASDGGDLIAVWTTASAASEQDTQWRVYAVMARVLLAWEPQATADDDDPIDTLEAHEQAVLEAVTPLLAGARVVSVDSQFFPNDAALEFVFLGELANPAAEV